MTSFKFRKNLVPKTFADMSAFIFISAVIPTVYWFEVFVVLPTLFDHILYSIHFVLGTFVLINIIGNFMAVMTIDTSTKGLVLPSQVPIGWHVCADCESVAPPRSRHCRICKSCILKKEHHCIFTGCCVGLRNHRYFYVFLIYMWLSTLYCSGLNVFFIWPYIRGLSWWAAVRLILPGVWLLWNPSLETLYSFLFSINMIGFLFLSVLVYHYTTLLTSNITTQENKPGKYTSKYDQGKSQNMKVVLGVRWYLTWIFPTINSALPCDGLDWTVNYKYDQSVRPKMK